MVADGYISAYLGVTRMHLSRIVALVPGLFFLGISTADAQCAPGTMTLIAHRDFAAAKRSLDLELRTSARNDSVLHCLGTLALEADDQEGAVGYFEKAIDIAPRPAHRVALAMALRSQAARAGMFRAAPLMTRMKTELETALGSDASLIDAQYILLQFYAQIPAGIGGDMARARGHAAALLRLSPERGHIGLGFIAEQEKNLVLAEREYRLAISTRPDSEPPYTAAGAFYRRQERWTDAISMYEKAARAISNNALSSKAANIHYLLGNSLEKAGNQARARAEYAAALRYNPDHAEARKALGGGRQ
jgi:tetratricopeptide (TPR) repeat protein